VKVFLAVLTDDEEDGDGEEILSHLEELSRFRLEGTEESSRERFGARDSREGRWYGREA
jgi:hypothetical protein